MNCDDVLFFFFPFVRERSVNVSEPESLELTISNLKPEESYSFRIVAYNDVGQGESSTPLRITTKPDRKKGWSHDVSPLLTVSVHWLHKSGDNDSCDVHQLLCFYFKKVPVL